MSSSHHTNTISETDIPTGDGFRYPPQVFTNPDLTATLFTSDNELTNMVNRKIFLGEYCEKCYTQTHPVLNRCWCNTSDWGEDVDMNNDENPNLEAPLMPQTLPTIPPPGWSNFRRKTIANLKANGSTSSANSQASPNNSISPEEFHSM